MAEKFIQHRTVFSRPGIGLSASVIQRNDLLFHTFVTDYPAIIFLRRGKKTVNIGTKKIVLLPGDAVAIAAGTTCDVENKTDNGQFESTWIVCAAPIISNVESDFPNIKKLKDVVALKGLGNEFIHSFERGVQAISAPEYFPELIAKNQVQEVLIWMMHAGYVFSSDEPVQLQRQVRLKIGAELGKKWISKDVAESLAMSEATFRRKLAGEGQSFSQILVDVRMTAALTLLQVTDTSISTIAFQVGYESASRFAVRFKKRFGFSPTAIRIF